MAPAAKAVDPLSGYCDAATIYQVPIAIRRAASWCVFLLSLHALEG